MKSLPLENQGVLALFAKSKKRGLLSFSRNISLQLLKFNKDLTIAKEVELADLEREEAYIDFIRINNHYYFIKQEYIKSDKSLLMQAVELDPKTMKLREAKTLATYDVSMDENNRGFFGSSKDGFAYKVDLVISPDSTTFGLFYIPSVKRKENVTAQYIVMDENLKKLQSNEYDFGVTEKKMEINTILIDKKGTAYFNYDVYDDKDSKSFKRVNGEKVPAYSSHLLIMENKKKTDIILDNENRFIKKITLGEDVRGNVSVFAFYKNFYRGNYAGVCRASLQELTTTKTSLPFRFFDFPQDILDKVDNDRQAKNNGDNKGIDTEFEFRTVVRNADNDFHLIMEYDRLQVITTVVNGHTQTTYRRYYGDIIVATLHKDDVVFTRLPKMQESAYGANSGDFLLSGGRKQFVYSYDAVVYRDKLLLFYNDDEDNVTRDLAKRPDDMIKVKKSAFSCATFNRKGELEKREIVFSHRDMDGYMTSSTLYQVTENTWSLFALNLGFFKYGTKIGKLTIK
ncbi:MAG: hypothetical protein ABIQ56_05865 [Chitinophagaceae bacterium]